LPILDCKFQIAIRADFPAANGELSILRRTFLNRQLAINNPIGAFIRVRLAGKNLQPSSETHPVTLIRRISGRMV